jgi:hypothetical protein
VTYTFTNGTVADGANVSTNFSNLVSGLSDGTKDLNMNAATFAGNLTASGNMVFGNATSDTISITARLITSLSPSASATYDLGTTGLLYNNVYSTYYPGSLGAVTTPTFTFNGDLNTGMWSPAADTLAFSTGGTERVRITSTGVGVGRAANSFVDVYGAYNGGTYGMLNLESTGTECSVKLFRNSGTAQAYKVATDNSGNFLVYDDTAGATRLTIAPSAGAFTIANLLTLTAGQIKFPATQNASTDVNTLDDYEEGTWTPSVGGNATYTAQQGRYTKIGRSVKIEMQMTVNVLGTGSATTISGLPFTSNTSEPSGGGTVNYFGNLAINYIYVAGYIGPNSASITFTGTTAAAAGMNTTIAIIGNGTEIRLVGHYTV